VAGTPSAISNGVASAGATKKPTLPPAANTLIAPALSPAEARAALPAAGWNIATPSPDSRIAHHAAT